MEIGGWREEGGDRRVERGGWREEGGERRVERWVREGSYYFHLHCACTCTFMNGERSFSISNTQCTS